MGNVDNNEVYRLRVTMNYDNCVCMYERIWETHELR